MRPVSPAWSVQDGCGPGQEARLVQDLHRGLTSDSRRSGKATEPLGRRSVREVNEPGGAKASATNKEEASGFDRRGVPVSRVGEVDARTYGL